MADPHRRLLAVLSLTAVPWTIVFARGTPTLFFPLGFVTLDPLSLTTIWDYYFRYTVGLPQYLLAFGIGVVLFAVAGVSAASQLVQREDARVTAAVLVLAGVSNLWFALGFLRRPGYVAIPVGTLLLWTVVWWYYSRALRDIVSLTGPDIE